MERSLIPLNATGCPQSAIENNLPPYYNVLEKCCIQFHHSENRLIAVYKKLERKDFGIETISMISLGSCTMKLKRGFGNASLLALLRWGNIHPFVPIEQAEIFKSF